MQRKTTAELHEAIRAEHERLTNVKELGVQKYSNTWIRNKIAEKFFKSPVTIDNILWSK